MQPYPVLGNLVSGKEVATSEEVESCEGKDCGVSQDEVGHQGTDEHDEGAGVEQGHIKHQRKEENAAIKLESPPGDDGVGEGLNSQEREGGDDPGNGVGGGPVGIVGGFPDEDEPLLDECGHGVVGGEEEEADCENEEREEL